MPSMRITMVQQPARAGAIDANRALFVEGVQQAMEDEAHIVVSSGRAITGDIGDLINEPHLFEEVRTKVTVAHKSGNDSTIEAMGTLRPSNTGRIGVPVILKSGLSVVFTTCTDIHDLAATLRDAAKDQPDLIAISAALPYRIHGPEDRTEVLAAAARHHRCAIALVNRVGGADRAVYDGGSVLIAADGTVLYRAPLFAPTTATVELTPRQPTVHQIADWPISVEEQTYTALKIGIRDYVQCNGFSDVVLGLSGGIDSALVAALTVDALGPDHVHGVAMPGPYSSEGSIADARELANRLGVAFDVSPITDAYHGEVAALGDLLDGPGSQIAKENLQARLRAMRLLTIANTHNMLVLNTCNKSEDAVGYATYGGDSLGAYAPLCDVTKGLVYRLAEWRNSVGDALIPKESIAKAPSAELSEGQQDTDTLPPYDVLDTIIERYLDHNASPTDIVTLLVQRFALDREHAVETVRWVLTQMDRTEWKRQQSPLGPQITATPFFTRQAPVSNLRNHIVA